MEDHNNADEIFHNTKRKLDEEGDFDEVSGVKRPKSLSGGVHSEDGLRAAGAGTGAVVVAPDLHVDRPGLLHLSDDVLLHIFSHCRPVDLRALSFSCRRLGVLCSDRSLWRRVDLRTRRLGSTALSSFVRLLPRRTTVSLSIRGLVGRPSQFENQPSRPNSRRSPRDSKSSSKDTKQESNRSDRRPRRCASDSNLVNSWDGVGRFGYAPPSARVTRQSDRMTSSMHEGGSSNDSAKKGSKEAFNEAVKRVRMSDGEPEKENEDTAKRLLLDREPTQGCSKSNKSSSQEWAGCSRKTKNKRNSSEPKQLTEESPSAQSKATAAESKSEDPASSSKPGPSFLHPNESHYEAKENGNSSPKPFSPSYDYPGSPSSGVPGCSASSDIKETDKAKKQEQEEKESDWTLTKEIMIAIRKKCPNLKELRLEYCFIDCNVIQPSVFPSTLETLSLRGSVCRNVPLSRSYLFRIQDYCPRLSELDLSRCAWLASHSLLVLSKMPSLRRLRLGHCSGLGECVAYASLSARYGFRSLEVLDIRGTPMGDSEVTAFSLISTLKELYLQAASSADMAGPSCCSAAFAAACQEEGDSPLDDPEDMGQLQHWEIQDPFGDMHEGSADEEWTDEDPEVKDTEKEAGGSGANPQPGGSAPFNGANAGAERRGANEEPLDDMDGRQDPFEAIGRVHVIYVDVRRARNNVVRVRYAPGAPQNAIIEQFNVDDPQPNQDRENQQPERQDERHNFNLPDIEIRMRQHLNLENNLADLNAGFNDLIRRNNDRGRGMPDVEIRGQGIGEGGRRRLNVQLRIGAGNEAIEIPVGQDLNQLIDHAQEQNEEMEQNRQHGEFVRRGPAFMIVPGQLPRLFGREEEQWMMGAERRNGVPNDRDRLLANLEGNDDIPAENNVDDPEDNEPPRPDWLTPEMLSSRRNLLYRILFFERRLLVMITQEEFEQTQRGLVLYGNYLSEIIELAWPDQEQEAQNGANQEQPINGVEDNGHQQPDEVNHREDRQLNNVLRDDAREDFPERWVFQRAVEPRLNRDEQEPANANVHIQGADINIEIEHNIQMPVMNLEQNANQQRDQDGDQHDGNDNFHAHQNINIEIGQNRSRLLIHHDRFQMNEFQVNEIQPERNVEEHEQNGFEGPSNMNNDIENRAPTEQNENEQGHSSNRDEPNGNQQRQNANEQRQDANEQRQDANEPKQDANEQRRDANEQRQDVNEQRQNANEQRQNANEQRQNENEPRQINIQIEHNIQLPFMQMQERLQGAEEPEILLQEGVANARQAGEMADRVRRTLWFIQVLNTRQVDRELMLRRAQSILTPTLRRMFEQNERLIERAQEFLRGLAENLLVQLGDRRPERDGAAAPVIAGPPPGLRAPWRRRRVLQIPLQVNMRPVHVDAASLVTDASLLRFGTSENVVNVGGAPPPCGARTSGLTVLVCRGYSRVTDRALSHLTTAEPQLRLLDLSNTAVTAEGARLFRASRPDCQLICEHLPPPESGE